MSKVRTFLDKSLPWITEFFQNIGELIGCFLLIVLALLLILIGILPAVIWKIIFSIKSDNRKARGIIAGTAHFFLGIAVALDQVGNVAFGSFFNWLFLIKGNDYPFGETHETVSEVLGWNQALENLNRKGLFLVSLLNVLEAAHCEKAMYSGLEKATYKVDLYKKRQQQLQTIENTKAFMAKY
jgi:hypothetical protein